MIFYFVKVRNATGVNYYLAAMNARERALMDLFFDPEAGCWFDFKISDKQVSLNVCSLRLTVPIMEFYFQMINEITVASFLPLWANLTLGQVRFDSVS